MITQHASARGTGSAMSLSMAAGERTLQGSAQKGGAVMAFDFGERRIGVAVGDREVGIAHPLETIAYRRDQDPLALIEVLVREWQPNLFVVGLPVSVDGSEHELAPLVRSFCAALSDRFGVATRLVDERYTSAEASEILNEAGVRGRRQKEYLDQVAAQTILEDFFAHDDAIA